MIEGFELHIDIEDNTELYEKALAEASEKILEAIGIQAEGRAKQELRREPKRIDTGLLRNSVTHAVSGKPAAIKSYRASYIQDRKGNAIRNSEGQKVRAGNKETAGAVKVGRYSGTAPEAHEGEKAVYIGTNVEYAIYVHQGTRKMAANPFIKNAVTRHSREYEAIAKSILEDEAVHITSEE